MHDVYVWYSLRTLTIHIGMYIYLVPINYIIVHRGNRVYLQIHMYIQVYVSRLLLARIYGEDYIFTYNTFGKSYNKKRMYCVHILYIDIHTCLYIRVLHLRYIMNTWYTHIIECYASVLVCILKM